MTDAAHIAADPAWLPHSLDMAARKMLFVKIARDVFTQSGFLADVKPDAADGAVWLPFDEVRAMKPETGSIHFIFHTAFCRSTLLARALNIEGVSAGMAEPGILAQIAGAGDVAKDLVKPVCDLLSRRRGEGEAVFVKPTNHANMLIPALLTARPDAKAVLMTNQLPSFLRSVDKRALIGRRWGRQLYLEVMGYAAMDLGMDAREQFSMTDLQAAGLAWFLSQRFYAMLLASSHGDRLRVLDGDRFLEDRANTLGGVLDLAELGYSPEAIDDVLEGPIFRKHAKLGGDYEEKAPAVAPALEQEIGQVQQWLGMIAEQAGVPIPAKHNLF